MTRRLLGLATYPDTAAATRFRLEALRPWLAERGITLEVRPLLSDREFASFYDPRRRFGKALDVARALTRRLSLLLRAGRYDGVFVQREAAVLGPAFIEHALHRVGRLPLIYDFDDAVWLDEFGGSQHPHLARLLKNPGKTRGLMAAAEQVVAGSRQLGDFARTLNTRVLVSPTVVAARAWFPLPGRIDGAFRDPDAPPTIGWIGTHTTGPYLDEVVPALRRLRNEGLAFRVRVVGANERPGFAQVGVELAPWTRARDILDFQDLDIGLAPLPSNPWTEGKCGFKQVQYMAVGVPCVTSLVGGARDFVREGENALVARSEDDWVGHLRALLTNRELRAHLAREGRRTVETEYCTEVQGPRVADAICRTLSGGVA